MARTALRAGVAIAATVAIVVTAAPMSMAGPAESVAPVPGPTPPPQPAAQPAANVAAPTAAPVTYTVVAGDTLSKIAAGQGLDTNGWRRLFDANPGIAHPDVITPGMQLRIPAPEEQVAARPLPTPPPPQAATSSGDGASSSSSGSSSSSPAPATTSGGGVWDRLAMCESSGNWSSSVGTYDGGLQFHPSTWKAYGGGQYAPTASQASREEQIAVAQRVLAGQGWGAWPACSSKLGLR
jgi:LysM repeat protein